MITRSPKEYELSKTIETLEETIKILKKLRDAEKKAWKNAGKAHSDVRSLGKAEVAGSIPVASSKIFCTKCKHLISEHNAVGCMSRVMDAAGDSDYCPCTIKRRE